MKVLFDHPSSVTWALDGLQTRIEQTRAALERRGIEIEHLRWWDGRQKGQIIHHFGCPAGGYIDFAHSQGISVVIAEMLGELNSLSTGALFLEKTLTQACRKLLPRSYRSKFDWDAYQKADAIITRNQAETGLMRSMFDAAPAKIHVIPRGMEGNSSTKAVKSPTWDEVAERYQALYFELLGRKA